MFRAIEGSGRGGGYFFKRASMPPLKAPGPAPHPPQRYATGFSDNISNLSQISVG